MDSTAESMLPNAVIRTTGVSGSRSQFADHFDAGLPGHPNVAQGDVEALLVGSFEGFGGGRCLLDRVTAVAEQRGEHLAHGSVVVNDKELRS
jgi:hypothetical protein